MAEPAVKESPDDGGDADVESEAEDEQAEQKTVEDDDVEMVQTDIETTGSDPDGFFDGVETDSGGDGAADSLFDGLDDGDGDGGGGDEPTEAAETRSSGLAQDINRGVARAAVIGLDETWETDDGERKKKDLKKEFEETFEAFRLGHYGSKVAEEYLLMEAEDIHPVWGLLGAALICAAVIVYRRPDGDQLVDSAKMKVGKTDLSNLKDAVTKDE